MSLAAKIFWNTLMVLAIVLGLTGWWSVASERAALEETITKHGKAIAQSLAAFSIEALVSQDYPSLDKALRTIGDHADNIVYLQISRGGHVVATFGQRGVGQTFTAPVILGEEGPEQQQIGEVSAILSKRDGNRLMTARIGHLLLNSLILFIVLALALHFLIHRLVLKRVAQLTKATDGVIAEHTPERAGTAAAPAGDELDLLHARYANLLWGLDLRERERTLTIAKLQAAQALLDDVANALPAALIVLTRALQIQYCNRAAHELAGRRLPSGQPQALLATLLPPLAPHLARIAEVADNRQAIELQRQFWPFANGQRIVNIAVYPLSSAAVGGLVIRIDDVTERTRLEEMMIQSEKLSSIGGLAAGVAHEINNPLGVMIQAAQNMERRMSVDIEANQRAARELGTDLATVRAYLEKRSILVFLDDIKNDGARAATIVRNLLEFSRKTEPVREDTDLAELVERAVEMARKDYDLKKRYDFRRIKLQVEVPAGLPAVPMIRSEVEQVILNLLKNAAQAMSEPVAEHRQEEPAIVIRAGLADGYAELRVQDNGPGFSDETKRRAFEPFFTTKAPGIGTGLGLWVSYMIMTDKHHGQLLLESQPGQGATFVLRFPL
ncbi:nitrogen regulation protein NR(II) [uncultured Thiodictyon sp.]|uniref:two-component system sensor histidine kinase NtrB n=1 Tax=uncultured Thiodictyon sp. TaxID=1846217 RepID=UPI0025D991FF|nr:PAS domain-containing sensor histidine kinase [uncultured Thiodictyon sp.]